MGYLRFRRTIKILPGIRINVGKRGVSTSIRVRGAGPSRSLTTYVSGAL